MKPDKRLQFRVTSTENHKTLFATRKEAEAYIRQLRKDKKVGMYTEFRIFEVDKNAM